MKPVVILSIVVSLLIGGCKYVAPLTRQHNIPIDSSVLGLWEALDDNGNIIPDPDKRMLVLKYSDTEYLAHHDNYFFRGYPIKIGGISCVQFQLIGSDTGPVKANSDGSSKIFDVATYELRNDELTISVLNPDLVSDKLKDSASLKREFLKFREDKNLFGGSMRFVRFASRSTIKNENK